MLQTRAHVEVDDTSPASHAAEARLDAAATQTNYAAKLHMEQQEHSAQSPQALYNNVLIRSDLWRPYPAILSSGMGYSRYFGMPGINTQAQVVAAQGMWNSPEVQGPCVADRNATPPTSNFVAQRSGNFWNAVGFIGNCDNIDRMDGTPVCFSWPIIGTPSASDFELTITNRKWETLWTVTSTCLGITPNHEFNERHCFIVLADVGNRDTGPDGFLPNVLRVVNKSSEEFSWHLVGPNGPESPAGLTRTTNHTAYEDCYGPYFMGAKLNKFSVDGEGVGAYAILSDPNENSGLHLYGHAAQYRIRLYYSGGMTPNGVNAITPDSFERLWSLNLEGGVVAKEVGVAYKTKAGKLTVVGLADLGAAMQSCEDYNDVCYVEDADNYIDIIFKADSDEVAALVESVTIRAGLFNPGGPGVSPTDGVPFTKASSPTVIGVQNDLSGKMQVTYCNGTFYPEATQDEVDACTAMSGTPLNRNKGATYPGSNAQFCKPGPNVAWDRAKAHISDSCPWICYDYTTDSNAECPSDYQSDALG